MNPSPALVHFGEELKLAREAAGLSQDQLGQAIHVSKSLVAMVENGRRVPQRDLAVAVDQQLNTGGRFDRMRRRLLVAESNPAWFRPWIDYERDATEIRWYEPLLVPGLLQTEAYARALLRNDEQVAARMQRQEVLERASLTVIIEEGVLHRRVADMHRQLQQLTTANATVLVLPADADTLLGTDGSFALARVDDAEVAYVDTPARGFVLTDTGVTSDVRRRWESLLTEALPRNLSQAMINEAAQRWKAQSS